MKKKIDPQSQTGRKRVLARVLAEELEMVTGGGGVSTIPSNASHADGDRDPVEK